MTTRIRRVLSAWSALVLIAGCGGESAVTPNAAPPTRAASLASAERTLSVELATTATGDAGMIFSIDGPNIISLTAAPGFQLVERRSGSGGRTRVDVLTVGPLRSGVIAWLTTKGVNSGNPYTAEVTQVAAGAAGGFAQRQDLSAYRLTVRR